MNKIKTIFNKLNIIEKILFILFGIIIIRLLTFKIPFLNNIYGINFDFFLITIFMNLFLIALLYRIFKISNIKFTTKEKTILIILSIIIIGFASYEIINRHMLYYQDNAVYYSKQIALRDVFMQNDLITACKIIVGDIWYSDYGCFLNLFLELTNAFTNKSTDSYVIATVVIIIPYLLTSLYALIKYLFKDISKHNVWTYMLIITSLMPILFGNLLEGMPDVFGLVFVFGIIILTINYNFKKIDFERLIILAIMTFFLIICRRWYLYFIIGYYISYVILLLLPLVLKKDFKTLKIVFINGLKFAIVYGIFLVASLYPMIIKIINANYKVSYVAYKEGNLIYEFTNQLKTFGLITIIFSLIGYLMLIKNQNQKYRKYLILLTTYFLTVIAFNTVQNFGIHHMLMLIPSVIIGIYLFIISLINYQYKIPFIIIIVILSINFIYSIDTKLKNNIFFTTVPLVSQKRSDINEIKTLSKWIIDNTGDEKTAYMIPHSWIYNPDIFKFALAPTIISYERLSYGSAMLGSQKFPVELFDANYILTSVPFTGQSIAYKYDEAFMNSPYLESNFKLIKEFDMHNGYIFKIYERIAKVTLDEITYYLTYFEDENKEYPNMYGEVIQDYIDNNFHKEVNNEN